jgi:hypothetical protein
MEKFDKAEPVRDASGYFSTGLYREKKPQEITLVANTHNEFAALTYEIVELVAQVPVYYLITQAGTVATAVGSVCFFLQAYERKEIACNKGDIISLISTGGGKANLIEKG